MENKPYYQCYSKPLKDKIEDFGIKSEFKAKHYKTDKVFWFFFFDQEGKLQEILDEWSANKPIE